MDIKKYVQSAIQQIEQEAERELQAVKDKVVREKAVPFNQEIDQARAKAESELAQKLNANITALQTQFAKDKQALVDIGEKKKAEYLNSLLASETYPITSERDKAVSKLKALIETKE